MLAASSPMGMHWLRTGRDVTCWQLLLKPALPQEDALLPTCTSRHALSAWFFWDKMGLVVLLMGSGDKEGLASLW